MPDTATSIRLRFAPSPTGYLHVGGARTALFNWLYARRHGGVFVLRIEDTDVERSSWEMVGGILGGLRWLGMDWDEGPEVGGPHGPYFQSERLPRYRAEAERLVAEGHAYYCYCNPDELRARREAVQASGGEGGEGWRYDRTCLALSPEEIARREGERQPRAIRFRVPEGRTTFTDLVRGAITVDHAHMEDFVILRSDSHPTYHLSVVVDDIDMRITHVVRGEDHISNTPKQVLLYEAFGQPRPAFAHLPLILGPDKRRLSKRHGATSVTEYERQGFLPEAMVNFLALLGWSPGSGDQELFTRDELVAAFTLEGISGGNAVFNPEKLEWFNNQHVMRLPGEDLARRLEPLFREAGLWNPALGGERRAWLLRVLELLKPRIKRLPDAVDQLRPFVAETPDYDEAAVRRHLGVPGMRGHLEALAGAYGALPSFDAASLEPALRQLAEARGLKAGALIHATRVAVTGRAQSPGLFEVLELVGRERTLARLRAALPLCGA
jgi:glutamyl-tRNA synthetase